MSIRYEAMHVDNLTITPVPAGTPLGESTVDEGEMALVFSYDEVVYLEGSKDQLIQVLSQALADLQAADPDGPIPPEFDIDS